MTLDLLDQKLIAIIQDGLELSSQPFKRIAEQIGVSEQQVINRLQQLKEDGTIKRLGVVVRHRELGFKANAMVVWDIPDDQVEEVARKIASFNCVTLCYQRPRRPQQQWTFNLFSMIHGKDRESVLQRLDDIADALELQDVNYQPLFSTRRFKQRGARYINPEQFSHASAQTLPVALAEKKPATHSSADNTFNFPLVARHAYG